MGRGTISSRLGSSPARRTAVSGIRGCQSLSRCNHDWVMPVQVMVLTRLPRESKSCSYQRSRSIRSTGHPTSAHTEIAKRTWACT